jgi:hypothetical protein
MLVGIVGSLNISSSLKANWLKGQVRRVEKIKISFTQPTYNQNIAEHHLAANFW